MTVSPAVRSLLEHLATAVLAVVLTWLGADLAPFLQHETGAWSVIGVLLAGLVQAANPLVQSFGVGSKGRHVAPEPAE